MSGRLRRSTTAEDPSARPPKDPRRTPRAYITIAAGLVLLGGCEGNSGNAGGGRSPAASSVTTGPAATTTTTPSSTRSAEPSPTVPDVRTISVTVAGGRVTPRLGRVKVARGKPVSLRVTSDVADEVHVHAYDLKRDVPAGGTATLTFTPDVEGIFEVELESAGVRLLELQVS